jgi:AAA15 family ATPase/GTPase
MIQKVHISNYKSVVDLELNLGRLNIFIGENGCGKTNILEAIALGSAAAANKLDNEFLYTRGIRVTEPNFMKSGFINNYNNDIILIFTNSKEETYKHIIDINNKKVRLQINNQNIIKVGKFKIENSEKINEGSGVVLGLDIGTNSIGWAIRDNDLIEVNLKIFDIYTNFNIYCPENYFLRNFQDEGQIRPLGIRGEGLFKHILELYKHKPEVLEEISENLKLIDWFQGFEIPKDLFFTEKRINIKDRFLAHLDYFDQRSANEGFLYLLFYFTLFISEFTPKFFAIDNIDNALNPKLCAKLIQVLAKLSKDHNKQVILTTHNPAILDGLDLTDDEQRLFTIYRNADGHTVAKRINTPKKINGAEPVRLSEAYIRGYLGGLPANF